MSPISSHIRRRARMGGIIFLGICAIFFVTAATVLVDQPVIAQGADPAAWGDDHVGKQLPLYMTGDECLFCHREVGASWPRNKHNTEMLDVNVASDPIKNLLASDEGKIFSETTYVLGGDKTLRFLKPNGKYGQLALHGARVNPHDLSRVSDAEKGWDDAVFGAKCAGCHATAVETEFQAFAQASLDCFVCHGEVPPGHQNEPTMAILAKKREKEPLVEMSLCGQCHLRSGVSKSSGLPYPNQFMPGDNLFKDFQVDFSDEAIGKMNPGDAHIFANVKDVALKGDLGMTCVTCHDIHDQSSRKHRVLPKHERLAYCAICHDTPGDFKSFKTYERHSAVCEY